jgi:hypothetical protein
MQWLTVSLPAPLFTLLPLPRPSVVLCLRAPPPPRNLLLTVCCCAAAGNNFDITNLNNIAAVLFMWVTLPAYGAAAYVPALVLERPLFTR